jgi:hypothetical protein
MTQTEIIAPPGYRLQTDLFADWDDTDGSAWRFLVIANLYALLPLGGAVLVLWLPYQVYLALGAPLAVSPNPAWPDWGYWLCGLVTVTGSMLLHELLHAAALRLCGYHPRLGYHRGYLYATIQRGQYLTRRVYLTMILTPITAMTILGGLCLPFLPPRIGSILLITLLLNAAASIGDLAVAARVWRWPRGTLFAEFGGIKVFTPQIW